MPPVSSRRRRARPVADAPIDALLPHGEELAKGWLMALLAQAPLGEAAAILATELTHDGPRLCQAVLRAIADDSDLRRLEPGGSLTALAARTGELAGARSAAAVSRAADALGEVIWSALRDELRSPDPDLVLDLSERVALVTGTLREAALDLATSEPVSPGLAAASPSVSAPPPSAEASRAASPASAGTRSHPAQAAVAGRGPSLAGPPSSAGALWMGALEDEISRAAGSPLSLLVAELEDVERVTAVETPAAASATFGHFAQAVRRVVRRQDILVCETDTRAWVIARDTARPGAQALGSRIAHAVGAAQPWRGAPMVASVGTAVLGEDGASAAELIECAEEARFGAQAAGDVQWPEQAPSERSGAPGARGSEGRG